MLFLRGDRQEERTVALPTAAFPDDIVVARAVISGPIYIGFEMSQKTLQYKLSACETITQGHVPVPSVTTQNLFQPSLRPECVCVAQLTGQWPVLSGAGLGQRVLLWPPLVNNPPFNSVCNLQTRLVKRTDRCCLSALRRTIFPRSKSRSQLSTIITHCGNTVIATQRARAKNISSETWQQVL